MTNIGTMSDRIEDKLIAVAAAFLNANPSALDIDSGPGDLPRWDSFAQVGLIAEVEARFDVAFDVEDLTSFETLRDIHDALQRKLAA
jgi:acyl carrier protein